MHFPDLRSENEFSEIIFLRCYKIEKCTKFRPCFLIKQRHEVKRARISFPAPVFHAFVRVTLGAFIAVDAPGGGKRKRTPRGTQIDDVLHAIVGSFDSFISTSMESDFLRKKIQS